ncbi:MAG: hypothetical protein ACREXV_02990 [Polaromonas sp.]
MSRTMEHAMAGDLNQAGEQGMQKQGAHDLDKQRLRILRCTAEAMASSPGGLRFKAGARPWLEGLTSGRPAAGVRRRGNAATPAACD